MANFSEKINNGWKKLTGRQTDDISLSDKPYPFHIEIDRALFMRLKTEGLYRRILNDCIKKSIWQSKDKDEIERSFYDCFENSENNCGLVSFIAKAMYEQKDKILVWKDGVLREAKGDEVQTIKDDYALVAKSKNGIIINFKDYELTKILKHYFSQLYDVNIARTTAVNIAASLKIQIDKLREMVSNSDADIAIKQAKNIADALKQGKSVLLDAGDKVDCMATINVDPLIVAKDEIYSEIAQQTSLPVSYISGEATTGASLIGDADINRESDAIEQYWKAIWKPIVMNLYDIQKVEYRTDKWRAMESKVRSVAMLETLDVVTNIEKRDFAVKILELDNATADKK